MLAQEIQDDYTLSHRYDALGNRTETQLPDGKVLGFNYDLNGLFTEASFNGQIITTVKRDHQGREIQRHQGATDSHYEYDAMGRLARHQVQHRESKTQLIQRRYSYNANGNLEQIEDLKKGTTRYQYDALDRLKTVEGYINEQFSFDPAGNLLDGQSQATGNRLTFHGDRHFEYDQAGNLIREKRGKGGKLETRYTYNKQNQLIVVKKDGQRVEYQYDALGRRISKQDAFGKTEFLWNGDILLSEQRKHQQKLYLYEPNTFRPLAQIEADQVYHYHLDHLGTPQELTNHSGKVVWSARYKVYGNVALKDDEEIENNLRFQGQYWDEETGLHYNRFRYYDPGTGQFTQQDPIGLLGGINNYQYAPNPGGWVDPLGLSSKEEYGGSRIPDDYDIAQEMKVYDVVEMNVGPYFVDDSERLYDSLTGISDILHPGEFVALRAYTGSSYKQMNGVLRGKYPELAHEWSPVNGAATTALNKLAKDPARVHVGTTYRGTPMTEENIHKRFPGVGETYADKGFSSSTTDPNKAFEGNLQMTIKSKTGVKIDDLSAIPSEDEVLFAPGKEFNIRRKEQLPDGTWEIDLEEK